MRSSCAKAPFSIKRLLVALGVVVGACGTDTPPASHTSLAAAAPTKSTLANASFAAILVQTGLVAPQYRAWVRFCDTTRVEAYHLPHTPIAVRSWLEDYYTRLADGETLRPDSLRFGSRHPAPPGMVVSRPLLRLTSAAAMQHSRQQTQHFLAQLKQAGLLGTAEYQYLLPLAAGGEFYDRAALLNRADDWWRQHQREPHPVVDTVLQQIGLLSPAAAQQLRHRWTDRWVVDPLDALSAVAGARVFSRRDYPAALGPYLAQLHQDVAALLPGFAFTHFQYEVVPASQSDNSDPSQPPAVLVRFRVGKQTYTQRSDLQMDTGQPGAPWARLATRHALPAEQFYQLFNRVLTDQRSPYRLAYLPSAEAEGTQNVRGRFGLARLTTAQFQTLDTLPASPLGASAAQDFRLLPTDSITAAIHTFTALGFFQHLSPQQREVAARRAQQRHYLFREDILQYYPGSIGVYEGWPRYPTWSYTRLVHLLARLSQGHFVPHHVTDNCQQTDGELRFKVGQRWYQTLLHQANDSPDPRLFQLVQRALHEAGRSGKIYQVRGDLGQSPSGLAAGYVFLLPAAAQRIRSQALLTLNDPSLSVAQQMAQEEAKGTP
jgi:hypothetical protein